MTRYFVLLVVGLMAWTDATPSHAEEDPVELFRGGMQAYRDGRCESAVEQLEAALAIDPDLKAARLPLADCYYQIGVFIGAINHIKVYIQELEPGTEMDRAQARLKKYQADLAIMAGLNTDTNDGGEDTTEDVVEDVVTTDVETRPATVGVQFPAMMIDVSVGGAHVATSHQPTFLEANLAVRVYPVRFIGLGLGGGLGVGGGSGVDGTLRFPEFRVTAGFAPQLGRALLLTGAELLLVVSEVGDQRGIDPGVMFVTELRGPIGDSPLYVGGAVSVGYLLDFYVGGRAVIGVHFGPREVSP
jgi:Tetratricopeptide repeat